MIIQKRINDHSDLHMSFNRKRVYFLGSVIFLIIFVLALLLPGVLLRELNKNEVIEVHRNFVYFQEQKKGLMEMGLGIAQAYQAFYRSSEYITVEENQIFLSQLTKGKMRFIRGISIIEDTTIVYNFPMAGNEISMNVDLIDIEDQRANVLKTKYELIPVFQGPVELLEGGLGYIIRVPILDNQDVYWGQVSVVLQADEINQEIIDYATQFDLQIAVSQNENSDETIFGSGEILEKNPMVYVSDSIDGWVIYALPFEGWNSNLLVRILVYVTGAAVGIILPMYYYRSRKNKYTLDYMLNHDNLTNLYNRHYLEYIQRTVEGQSVKEGKAYGLMHIDIDDFKLVNDRFGHLIGDEVLKSIGRILLRISRHNELVFRIGGDEFLIMIPEVKNYSELVLMRARYQKAFEAYFLEDEHLKLLRPSIGIALYTTEGQDFDGILRIADMDMYQQKRSHKEKQFSE